MACADESLEVASLGACADEGRVVASLVVCTAVGVDVGMLFGGFGNAEIICISSSSRSSGDAARLTSLDSEQSTSCSASGSGELDELELDEEESFESDDDELESDDDELSEQASFSRSCKVFHLLVEVQSVVAILGSIGAALTLFVCGPVSSGAPTS